MPFLGLFFFYFFFLVLSVAHSRLFFIGFWHFQTVKILTTHYCEKLSIQCQDLNSQHLNHESSPMAINPRLLPSQYLTLCCINLFWRILFRLRIAHLFVYSFMLYFFLYFHLSTLFRLQNHFILDHVISLLALHSDDPSSNTAEVWSFYYVK